MTRPTLSGITLLAAVVLLLSMSQLAGAGIGVGPGNGGAGAQRQTIVILPGSTDVNIYNALQPVWHSENGRYKLAFPNANRATNAALVGLIQAESGYPAGVMPLIMNLMNGNRTGARLWLKKHIRVMEEIMKDRRYSSDPVEHTRQLTRDAYSIWASLFHSRELLRILRK